MAIRTFKLYGVAFLQNGTANITVNYNNVEVFSGPVTTCNEPTPLFVGYPNDRITLLAQWESTTDVTGNIPISITANSGDVFWTLTEANYSGISLSYDPPVDPENPVPVVLIQPVDFYRDPNINTEFTDGRTNVKMNGVTMTVGIRPSDVTDPGLLGDWFYEIPQGSTLSCDIYIDPDLIVLQ